jgi:hypothetical protein
MKDKKKNPTIDDAIPARNVHQRNSIVEAVVIHTPDLSLYLKIQNLLNFLIEGLKNFNVSNLQACELPSSITLCINHLKSIDSDDIISDEEIKKLLKDFIEATNSYIGLITVFHRGESSECVDPVNVVLPVKLSRIQWLAVCLLEELKRPFNRK